MTEPTNQKEQEEINRLNDLIKEKNLEIASLQDALSKSQEFIVSIHQSMPLKLFRNYDASLGKIIPFRPKKLLKTNKKKTLATSIKNSFIKKTKKDIICFPMINWNYRYQRPQHLLQKFADNGHTVFYLTSILQPLNNAYEIHNIKDNIYETCITSPRYFDIYKDTIGRSQLNSLINSIRKLINDLELDPILFVMFPTWLPLALQLKKSLGCKMIYDCVDSVQEFPNINNARKKEEIQIVQQSDLVISSSTLLHEKIKKSAKKAILIPNAGNFAHFNKKHDQKILLDLDRPIAGYFGAIAEWFDVDLVEFLARQRPNLNFVLIGDTYGSNLKKLFHLDNVHILGERPYSELGKYLQEFDACLIPFKLTPLIKSAHPIKVYEYLSAGKPVIATKIPDLLCMTDVCYVAEDKIDFLNKLDVALVQNNSSLEKHRIEFARNNTWDKRFYSLYSALSPEDWERKL